MCSKFGENIGRMTGWPLIILTGGQDKQGLVHHFSCVNGLHHGAMNNLKIIFSYEFTLCTKGVAPRLKGSSEYETLVHGFKKFLVSIYNNKHVESE
jgi:hypothetical protein